MEPSFYATCALILMQGLTWYTLANPSFALQLKTNLSLINRDICNSLSAMFFYLPFVKLFAGPG